MAALSQDLSQRPARPRPAKLPPTRAQLEAQAQKPPQKRPNTTKKTDWATIERDFTSGALTGSQLEAKHGLSRVSIWNKAKREGWRRGVPASINRAVARKIIKKVATGEVSLEQLGGDIHHVEAMISMNVEVILRHRGDIRGLQELANGQLAELRAATVGADSIKRVLELAHEGGALDSETLKEAVKDVRELCKLHSRMRSLGGLTGIYAQLQTMERQAFGIKNDENPAADEEDEENVKGLLIGFVDAPYREVE